MIHAGDATPLVVPYCARCDLPVERIVFDRGVTGWRWGIQGQCCGVTMGAKLSQEEIIRINTTGEKFYLIPKARHVQEIRPMAKLGAPEKRGIVVPMRGRPS